MLDTERRRRASARPSIRSLARALAAPLAVVLTATVAPSSSATVDTCANAAVRAQQGAQHLQDCRAYELVSPAHKGGYELGTNGGSPNFAASIAPDGKTISYDTHFPLPGAESGGKAAFTATRTSGSWSNVSLLKAHGPNSVGLGAVASFDTELLAVTPDQRTAVYWDCTTAPWGAIYIRRPDGSRQQIASATQRVNCRWTQTQNGRPSGVWMSADGTHVVFNTTSRIGPATGLPGTNRILYEWVDDGDTGTLRVVSRTNDSELTLLSASGHASVGASIVSRGAGSAVGLRNSISADGSQIAFQLPAPTTAGNLAGHLYLRRGGQETIHVSSPADGYVPDSPVTANGTKYLDAARNGSVVYFYANGDLTDEAPPEGGLYRYLVASRQLDWIDSIPIAVMGAREVSGVASVDGRRFYYRHGRALRLADDGQVTEVSANMGEELVLSTLGYPTANMTDDGRYLATVADMTRLARYDAQSGALDLAPLPEGSSTTLIADTFNFPLTDNQSTMTRDGRWVFFTVDVPLVARDTNNAPDVYGFDFEAGGLQLISTGRSRFGARLLGTDDTARSVFFADRTQLVPQDGDHGWDLYVARVGGGFLFEAPAAPCEGDACQAPYSAPPAPAQTATGALTGRGNVTERRGRPRCARLQTRANRLSRRGRALSRRARQSGRKRAARYRRRARQVNRRAVVLRRRAARCAATQALGGRR